MTNLPALIVHHRRFTIVIALLLACLLVIAAVGISIELYKVRAGVALMLSPQILVLLAAYLAKTACDRWAISAVCLTVSAEGLMLPGLTQRPIPWTAVRSVRGVCCSPAAGLAATPRHYVLFDVEAPESFGVARRSAVQKLIAPLPPGVPPLALDLSELDTGKEAIVEAVRRFHPQAVSETDAGRPAPPTGCASDASIRFPSAEELSLGVSRSRAAIARGIDRRHEILPTVIETWRRSKKRVGAGTQGLVAAAVEVQHRVIAGLRHQAYLLRQRAAASIATALEAARMTANGIGRHLAE